MEPLERPYRDRFALPDRIVLKGEPDLGGWYTDEEIEAVERVLRAASDWRSHFTGEQRSEFEREFAAYVGTEHAIATNGGGTGLDLAVACLDADPGDEVISCATNFVGTHLAVLGQGLRLVLCEPDPRTLNIDPDRVEVALTSRTRAILVTHMNGMPARVGALAEIAAAHVHPRHGPPRIICDAARACGADGPDGRVGKTGWITVFSFHRKKLMTTLGEGGMVTTDCAATAQKLRRLRSFGGGRDWGSNYKMTEAQAAFGRVQLRRLDAMNHARISRALERTSLLRGARNLMLPEPRNGYRDVYYLYTILVDEGAPDGARDRIIQSLATECGIGCAIANPPTYWDNRLIRDHVRGQGRFPIAESIGRRVFCPPLHPLMTSADNHTIADALNQALIAARIT